MTDLFISYSRRDKNFVRIIHERLEVDKRDVWVDWENIPLTAEWLEEIYLGIESSDAFVYIISPDSVRSEVCTLELKHAIENNKRLIPILHRDLVEESDQGLLDPAISSHNWIFFRDQDDFEESFKALIAALDTDLEYVRLHTRILVRAMDWNDKERDGSLVLRGDELRQAVNWLADVEGRQPPPAPLHSEYIRASQVAQRNRNRIRLLVITYGLVVLVLAIAAFWQASRADQNARVAEANAATAIAAESTAIYNEEQAQSLSLASSSQHAFFQSNDPDIARALALKANQVVDTPVILSQNVLSQVAVAPGTRWKKDGFIQAYSSIDISPDSTLGLAVKTDPDNEILLLDLETQAVLYEWNLESTVSFVRFSLDQRLIAAGLENGHLLLIDSDNKQIVRDVNFDNSPITSLSFSPDNKSILVNYSGGKLVLAALDSLEVIQEYENTNPEGEDIWKAVISDDGKTFATAGSNGTVQVRDIKTGEALKSFETDGGWTFAVDMHPDNQHVIAAFEDNSVRYWDLETDEMILFQGHVLRPQDVVIAPDGQFAYSAGDDAVIIQWNLATGVSSNRLIGHRAGLYSVDVSSDGSRLFSGSFDGTVRYWDVDSGAQLKVLRGHTDEIWAIDAFLTADGESRLLTGSRDTTIKLWDLDEGKLLKVFNGHEDTVYSVAVSPSKERILSAGRDGLLILWDIQSREIIRTLSGHQEFGRVFDASFSPDNLFVVSGGDEGKIFIWDLTTGEIVRTLEGHGARVRAVAYSPDGRLIASGSQDGVENNLLIWDANTGEILQHLQGHNGIVYSLDFSPDSRFLASAGEDRSVIYWDLTESKIALQLYGHTQAVRSVAFNKDGTGLISGADDGTVRLWDLSVGSDVLVYLGHKDAVLAVDYSGDGQTILSGSKDATVREWLIRSISDLIDWTLLNRYIPELSCDQLVFFGLPGGETCK
ncbi:hypothetical protein MASR2M15_02740 [Anaerolineales bacterium]